MTVENVTYIDDLDPAYPDGADSMSEGDDHIRNIKKSIKATFPKVAGEVPLVIKGDGVTGLESSTEFGNGPDSNHNFVGDVFVGYDAPIAQPDDQNGTLLCARGVLIGRGRNPGDASIGMEGNIIWGLGDPQADDHAVSRGWVKSNTLTSVNGVLTVPNDLVVNGITYLDSATIDGNATIGANNYSTIHTKGDFYVGYESTLPDNNDTVGGTLFLARGALVGRGLPVGSASIGMNDNVIWGLGQAISNDQAPNWGQVKGLIRKTNIDIAEAAISRLEGATDLDSVKEAIMEMLKEMQKES